ncbi:DNA glycosylase [Coemansia spiralis]|nr:DNA glycosylase [Coemansia spiralis]
MALSRDSDSDTSYISLCQSIIYQQLAGKAAEAILLRFLKRYAHPLSIKDFVFPSPQQVILFDVDEMRAIGLGQRKAEYLKEVAKNFSDGTLSEERLAAMSDEEVSRALVAIRGIGQWTADMFLMFHLKRPNVLPTLDLAVRKAMCHHFGVPFGKKTPTHEQMVELAQVWEPYRSVATWYMWRLIGTITQKS